MEIADRKYVSFITYRRTGAAVETPVWIAPLGDGTAGFTTEATSGKAKRLAHTPAVTLQPCDVRGRLTPGTQPVAATARVVTGAEADRVRDAIRRKYRLLGSLLFAAEKVRSLVTRRPHDSAAVIVTFDDAAA